MQKDKKQAEDSFKVLKSILKSSKTSDIRKEVTSEVELMVWDAANKNKTLSVIKHKLTDECFMKSKEMNQDRTEAPYFDMPFLGYNEAEFGSLLQSVKVSLADQQHAERNDTTGPDWRQDLN